MATIAGRRAKSASGRLAPSCVVHFDSSLKSEAPDGATDSDGPAKAMVAWTVRSAPLVGDPDVAGRTEPDVDQHLHAAADIAAGRRDGVAGLHVGRAVFGAKATQLDDSRRGAGQVGNPDVVVAVDGDGPRSRNPLAIDRREARFSSVGAEDSDAAPLPSGRLRSQSGDQHLAGPVQRVGIVVEIDLHRGRNFQLL